MSEELTTLPAVAKNIFVFCKKCDVDRFHKVLAHTSEKAAKIECEVCKSKKTFTLAAAKKKTVGGAKVKTPRGVAASARAEAARKSAHSVEFQQLRDQGKLENTAAYSMKNIFKEGQALKHPKFGIGYIKMATSEKIEVIFEEEVKSLIHNRQV
ncbi:MAG: hypothetical protein AB7O96_07255 [Pseudobdellovibrionaceae bacterium]